MAVGLVVSLIGAGPLPVSGDYFAPLIVASSRWTAGPQTPSPKGSTMGICAVCVRCLAAWSSWETSPSLWKPFSSRGGCLSSSGRQAEPGGRHTEKSPCQPVQLLFISCSKSVCACFFPCLPLSFFLSSLVSASEPVSHYASICIWTSFGIWSTTSIPSPTHLMPCFCFCFCLVCRTFSSFVALSFLLFFPPSYIYLVLNCQITCLTQYHTVFQWSKYLCLFLYLQT